MIAGTIYTEPATRCEILIMDHGAEKIGAVYDPRRSGDALPWHLNCDHCRRCRQAKLHPDLKRSLLIFASHQKEGCRDVYAVPSRIGLGSQTSYILRHWSEDNDHYADVECPNGTQLQFSLPEDRPLKIKGNGERRGLILLRAVRMIFSGRPALPSEIVALASFFERSPEIQKKRLRNLCYKIDWSKISSELVPRVSITNRQPSSTSP